MSRFYCRSFVVGVLFTMAISHLSYKPEIIEASPKAEKEIGVDAIQGWPAVETGEDEETPEGCVSLRRRGGSC